MRPTFIPIPCCLLLALSAGMGDAIAIEHYEGLAYAKNSGKLLYRESHWIQDKKQRLVLYRCPDGAAFARKRVVGSGPAPDFELVDGRDGYREGIRTRNGMREVYTLTSAVATEQTRPLFQGNSLVIDAGFDAYARQHWDALEKTEFRTEPRRVRFLVPSRLESIDFQLTPLVGDANNRRYRLALDAWYSGILPTITITITVTVTVTVTYAAAYQRLVRFEGIGNLRGNDGRHPAIRIEFPANKRTTASLADVANAARMPLVKACVTS